jgi:uncharacterized flavoprotein (TIGR03862 family)
MAPAESSGEAPCPIVAVIGGGPAGLSAAEWLAGHADMPLDVHVFDAKPSFARKFLMAGKSGLNLTHAEELSGFVSRFGAASAKFDDALRAFPPDSVRAWADSLGIETFVGSSGRIFPRAMKASPLLRAWIARLRTAGVSFHPRHRWAGWNADGTIAFETPDGRRDVAAGATVLALGGASWPRLGSDGQWQSLLAASGIEIQPLRPANCGFEVQWSAHLRSRFAGAPVKSVVLTAGRQQARGDFVVTSAGIEGSAVYALAADLRNHIDAHGAVTLTIDLAPARDLARLTRALSSLRGKPSLANQLRKAAGLDGVKASLVREAADPVTLADPARLAQRIKGLPLTLTRPRPLAEAISTAGGVALAELDEHFMLTKLPGVFAAGEMLDWEAPTGGYLLTACFATGRAAGRGVVNWVRSTGAS